MSPFQQGVAILVAAWVGASGVFVLAVLAGKVRLRRRRERGDGAGER